MNIDRIKINEYGGLKDKDIELKKGLNIIHGSNESGKSTLLSYINNMLYGISRNKDGKDVSEYEKYKPWNSNEFSGKISYSLDNGEKFEIFRDFNKKIPQIYNENLEDISQNFSVDKKEGNQFFLEQTGINKQMYLTTVVTMQQEVRLEEKEQNTLIQKIANIAGTGEDNISYKKAQEKLQLKIRDEIGTSNTKQRPINNIEKELKQIEEESKKIEPYKNRKYELEAEKETTKAEIKDLEEKRRVILEIKKAIDNQELTKQKIEISETEISKNNIKLKSLYAESDLHQEKEALLKDELNRLEQKEEDLKKRETELKAQYEAKQGEEVEKGKNNIFPLILFIVFMILSVVSLLIKDNIAIIICVVGAVLSLGFEFYVKAKNKKRVNSKKNAIKQEKLNLKDTILNIEKEEQRLEQEIKEIVAAQNIENSETNKIKGQLDFIENKNRDIFIEQSRLKEEIKNNLTNKKQELRQEGIKIEEFEDIFNNDKIVNIKLNETEEILNDAKIRQKALEIEENTLIPKLDKLLELKERKINCQNEYVDLIQKAEIIKLAIENLEEAYEEMKKNITPQFTQNLSEAIKKISNDKYSKVTINDEKGMIVETKRGEYVEAEKLSCGTIDQLYLGLRLSMIDDLTTEKMPIMLDETFAYFDEERLRQALKYLNENLNEHQAIIFTCSNRERDILNELKIEYNNIELR